MPDDIVARLRGWSRGFGMDEAVIDMRDAADEIERLRNELAARCRDHGGGAHTAAPVEPFDVSEPFTPEAL